MAYSSLYLNRDAAEQHFAHKQQLYIQWCSIDLCLLFVLDGRTWDAQTCSELGNTVPCVMLMLSTAYTASSDVDRDQRSNVREVYLSWQVFVCKQEESKTNIWQICFFGMQTLLLRRHKEPCRGRSKKPCSQL